MLPVPDASSHSCGDGRQHAVNRSDDNQTYIHLHHTKHRHKHMIRSQIKHGKPLEVPVAAAEGRTGEAIEGTDGCEASSDGGECGWSHHFRSCSSSCSETLSKYFPNIIQASSKNHSCVVWSLPLYNPSIFQTVIRPISKYFSIIIQSLINRNLIIITLFPKKLFPCGYHFIS